MKNRILLLALIVCGTPAETSCRPAVKPPTAVSKPAPAPEAVPEPVTPLVYDEAALTKRIEQAKIEITELGLSPARASPIFEIAHAYLDMSRIKGLRDSTAKIYRKQAISNYLLLLERPEFRPLISLDLLYLQLARSYNEDGADTEADAACQHHFLTFPDSRNRGAVSLVSGDIACRRGQTPVARSLWDAALTSTDPAVRETARLRSAPCPAVVVAPPPPVDVVLPKIVGLEAKDDAALERALQEMTDRLAGTPDGVEREALLAEIGDAWLARSRAPDTLENKRSSCRKKAIEIYKQILDSKTHHGYNKMDGVRLKTAQAQYEDRQLDNALESARSFVMQFSQSPLAPDGYMLLGDIFCSRAERQHANRAWGLAVSKDASFAPLAEQRAGASCP